ncbi:nuclease EXOG, mitochondrial isoform X3 [Lepus europaeus]|uniref:nuclease EXOG, mitochondrial isoform X3 n=1 Tax=Lepus europaeus TaxID=9983 RepID=UPI002B49D79B|nr:nuclease EXOG, mitochondrial isoform X3 [Lepus europaeus]
MLSCLLSPLRGQPLQRRPSWSSSDSPRLERRRGGTPTTPCPTTRRSGCLDGSLSIYPRARSWVMRTGSTVNSSPIPTSLQPSVPSTRTMLEKAMAETFYLSNIVPQDFDNNSGFWNRVEMYCRELTERFEDVWIVSGPLTLPQTGSDGKKTVSYQKVQEDSREMKKSEKALAARCEQLVNLVECPGRRSWCCCCRIQVIGDDNVAVPSHLYKVILARRSPGSTEPLALGAFVVPNEAIGFQPQLADFQVSLQELERLSGLVFFPRLDRTGGIRNICSVDTCKLLDFQEFTLYLSTRKIEGARSVLGLEKVMEKLKRAGIEPDDYFLSRYEKKLEELKAEEQAGTQTRKPS